MLANGQSLCIRPVRLEDAPHLLATFQQLVQETDLLLFTYEEAREYDLQKEQAFIQDYLDHPENLFLVAIVDGQIVGSLSVSAAPFHKQQHTAEMGIAILRKYWNLGIGRRMINLMLRWGAAHPQLEMICLKVFSNNEKAIRLYKHLGFAESGLIEKAIRQPDGSYTNLLHMVRWLREPLSDFSH